MILQIIKNIQRDENLSDKHKDYLIENIMTARDLAIMAHASQSYGDKHPYIYHLDKCATVMMDNFNWLYPNGKPTNDMDIINHYYQAAYLHDVLEDTVLHGKKLSYNDLNKYVHVNVCELVFAVSDGKGRNRKEKKEIMHKDIEKYPKSITLKLCDIIANVEQSIKENSNMFFIYEKEFNEFKEKFKPLDHNNEYLWNRLKKNFLTPLP